MTDFKHKTRERLSRGDAGRRLVAFGQALIGADSVALDTEDGRLSVPVADELDLRYKAKAKGEQVELELELRWSVPEPTASGEPGEAGTAPTDRPAVAAVPLPVLEELPPPEM